MIQKTPVSGLFFVCDHTGKILKILRDDIHLFPGLGLPVSFFALFDISSNQNSKEFWNVLIKESTVLDWELNVNTLSLPAIYKFSGFVTGDEILITALKFNETLMAMFDEMMIMNNEQQNLLRHSAKTLNTLRRTRHIEDVDILNEMTLLNNELVNTQRKLVKQNAEITRLNNQLQSVNADLEQFTYVASHDLKEPLRMVTGFMELLKIKYGNQLDEKANTYIDFSLDGASRLQNMVSDLLELSRTGRSNTIKSPEKMEDILREVKENIIKLSEENKAEIIVKTELPILLVYRPDITRLFQNLLSNAIKFRKKEINPVILVNVTEKEMEWLFSIEDNGIGIEKDKFKKVFEVFARLHSRKTYEGSGIGLAICKKIVEQNGGEIWLESEAGKGTTVYFTIKK